MFLLLTSAVKLEICVSEQCLLSADRLIKVCRDLSTSSSPTSMLKQCQLQLFALDHVQLGFEYLHWLVTPQPLWVACACVFPPSLYQKCFVFRWNFAHLNWCPLPLALPVCAGEKSPFPVSSSVYTHWQDSHELSSLQAKQFQLSQPFLTREMLQCLNHLSDPSIWRGEV